MKNITIYHPGKLVFGKKSPEMLKKEYLDSVYKRLYIITIPEIFDQFSDCINSLKSSGISVKVNQSVQKEPSFSDFRDIAADARTYIPESIAGIGGGSVMDVAKLLAALLQTDQSPESVVGRGLVKERRIHLVCIPTTSGTGSEMSPNAILSDEDSGTKKGIISPFLVPDMVFIDPELTFSLPPEITAYTGMDALTHCIEAYANRNAHPVIDRIAIEGIRLIGRSLNQAFNDGHDPEARSDLALGSMYGGMCLGPVNTAAVHALAYPLGSNYRIAHGISNALLLPYVMEFNLEYGISRYNDIALALGVGEEKTKRETAMKGIGYIRKLIDECNLPSRLYQCGISSDSIDEMALTAYNIQRLLQNNIRELNIDDIRTIYRMAS